MRILTLLKHLLEFFHNMLQCLLKLIIPIQFCCYILGTSPGAQDVSPFTPVGQVKEAILSDLKLKPGFTYYASIRGQHIVRKHECVHENMLASINP